MQVLKTDIQKDEESLKPIMEEWQKLMLQVPNIPDMTVPDGDSDADNEEIKTWGETKKFDFTAKDHVELMLQHGMVDFERGAKVHGFRLLLVGMVSDCQRIWNYANDFFSKRLYLISPNDCSEEQSLRNGTLPNEVEDIYKTQDDDYLAGTSEVSVMGYHADEILEAGALPVKFLGFSPCYRREAGSHGKDTKGLIRVHEFKLEQVILREASHETSVKDHEELNRNTEEFIESLQIPYHTVLNCGGIWDRVRSKSTILNSGFLARKSIEKLVLLLTSMIFKLDALTLGTVMIQVKHDTPIR